MTTKRYSLDNNFFPFLLFCRCWIRDPRSGIHSGIRVPEFAIRDPGSAIRDPGSEIRDPGSGIRDLGSEIRHPASETRDPRWIKVRIRDKHLGSVTMLYTADVRHKTKLSQAFSVHAVRRVSGLCLVWEGRVCSLRPVGRRGCSPAPSSPAVPSPAGSLKHQNFF